jgi:RNA polymerase sigma-70 factor (ECF subfamily)
MYNEQISPTTPDADTALPSDDDSLSIGPDPILVRDNCLIDPMIELDARFKRDAIPLTDRLFAGAMRLTRNKHDAEDLLQETMLHAYTGFHTFREGTNLDAWLNRIMHNTWINQYRKKQRRLAEISLEIISAQEMASDLPRASNTPRSAEVVALESLPDDEIKTALMTLRVAVRNTIYYADVEGYSYKQIANIMDTSVGTVMSRLHRGRQRLRAALLMVAEQRGFASTQERDDPRPMVAGLVAV